MGDIVYGLDTRVAATMGGHRYGQGTSRGRRTGHARASLTMDNGRTRDKLILVFVYVLKVTPNPTYIHVTKGGSNMVVFAIQQGGLAMYILQGFLPRGRVGPYFVGRGTRRGPRGGNGSRGHRTGPGHFGFGHGVEGRTWGGSYMANVEGATSEEPQQGHGFLLLELGASFTRLVTRMVNMLFLIIQTKRP